MIPKHPKMTQQTTITKSGEGSGRSVLLWNQFAAEEYAVEMQVAYLKKRLLTQHKTET
jgi:hypothetical protein